MIFYHDIFDLGSLAVFNVSILHLLILKFNLLILCDTLLYCALFFSFYTKQLLYLSDDHITFN